MAMSNSYEVISVEQRGVISIPEIQNMQVGSHFSINETPSPANGYGVIHTFMQIMSTQRKLGDILEIGAARTGFSFWRSIRDDFPGTKYTGFDHLDLPNIELDDSTHRVVGYWPHNASEIVSDSTDLVFHHALGPQLVDADMQDYSDEIHTVLREGGLYIGCHPNQDSHPFLLSHDALKKSDFAGSVEIVLKNNFAAHPDYSWADSEIRAVIAEKKIV